MLYNRWYPDIWAYCRRRVSDQRVDDLVAETFMTAWRRIDDVPEGPAARLWLYRVAYRAVGHEWRGRSRRRRLDQRLKLAREPFISSPERAVLVGDELDRVLEAARNLKDDDAELLRLVTWERLPPSEIAKVLDVSPNVVSQRVRRARATLTKQFERLERRTPDRTPAVRNGGTR